MAKGDKKRPQYIEKMLVEVNDDLRRRKVKDTGHFPYADPLFSFMTNYLSNNGWYRGWNIHVDREITISTGTKTIRALAGPYCDRDEMTKVMDYVQIW